jgi:glycoprotein endo-alpha-1,2-mannosidase
MLLIKDSGADGVIVPWNGTSPPEATVAQVVQMASSFHLKVGLAIPAYPGRSSSAIAAAISQFVKKFGIACLAIENRSVVIIEDSESIDSIHRIASTMQGLYFIGTGRKLEYALDCYEDGFRGLASFFPSTSDSQFADTAKWRPMAATLAERGMRFIPTVSPGINETALSVQLTFRARSRFDGEYYDDMWKRAIETGADIVLVNSFNNWLDGTAIEPVSNSVKFPLNEDIWVGTDPEYFIKKTKQWTDRFRLGL